MSWYFALIISQYVILYSCQLVMLLQYGPNDLNRDNPCFSEWAHLWLNEADYLESADWSDQEARRVLVAEMILWEIPHFSQPEVHLVLFVKIFKYMAFLQMQESRRARRKSCHGGTDGQELPSGQRFWPRWSLTTHKCHHPYSTWSEVQFSLQGIHSSPEYPQGSLHLDSDECLCTILWPSCNCGGSFKGLPWGITHR